MKKLSYILVLGLLVMSFAACSNQTNNTPKDQIFTPGTYTKTVKGHNGDIVVETTFSPSQVTKIEVKQHSESPGTGDTAMQTTSDEIIAKQGFDVDIVSGATWSSYAILEAVSSAAIDAGAKTEVIKMKEEGGDETTPAPPYKPGTYSATTKGYGGNVTVTVTVDADKITDIKVDGASETSGIGSLAVTGLPAKIVEANSADIDTVTGATFSSKAILLATKTALKDAK